MAKTIKNKVYNEFWEDDKVDIQKSDTESEKVSSEEIKKLEKKITKKVTGLEKELKELKEESKVKEEIQPINKPRGWHAKNSFIDDNGNEFSKGKYVGKVEESIVKPNISDERKMEIPKEISNTIEKIKKIEAIKLPITKSNILKTRKILTDKDIYQQYIEDNIPFKMYFRGNLIFDSKIQPKKNHPLFQDDGFILFGKNYIYRGIRIEKY